MRERVESLLRRIAADRGLTARWLNTVSLLEFIGARKISRTVADRHPSLEVLQHLADETRHALAFKRLAVEVSGGEVGEYLAVEEAKAYFQKLDRELAAWATDSLSCPDERLHYLLTTAAVERRAMQIYPLMKAATSDARVREELGRVVTEEQSHRRELEERCERWLRKLGADGLTVPLEIEARHFTALLQALERAVELPTSEPATPALG